MLFLSQLAELVHCNFAFYIIYIYNLYIYTILYIYIYILLQLMLQSGDIVEFLLGISHILNLMTTIVF